MEINKLSIAFPAPAAKPVAEPTVSAPAIKPVADKAKPEPIEKGIDNKDPIVKDDVVANDNKVQHQKHTHGIVPLDAMIAAMNVQQNQPAPAITFAPGVGTPTADEATPTAANITIGTGDTKVEIAGEFAAVTPIKVLPPTTKNEFSGLEDAEALALKLKLNPGANAGMANVETTKASFTFATIQAAVPNPPTISANTKQPAEDVMHWAEDVHVWAEDPNFTAPAATTKQLAEDVMHWPEDVQIWNENSNIDPATTNTTQPAEDVMHWPEDTHDWNADISYTAPAPTTKQLAEDVMHWPEDVQVWNEGSNIDPVIPTTNQPAEDVMHWAEDTMDWGTEVTDVATPASAITSNSEADLLSKKIAINQEIQSQLQLDTKLKMNSVEELMPAADIAADQAVVLGPDGDETPATDISVDSAFAETLLGASDVLAPASSETAGSDTGTPHFSTQSVDKSNATDSVKPEVKQLTAAESSSVLKQVADRLEVLAAARPKHGITVHLDPQEFGSITLIVKNSGKEVEAQIFANHDGVRAALEQNKAQLANNLESRGIALQSMTVSTDALNSQAFGDAQNRTQQSARPTMTTRTLDVDSTQGGMTLEAIREYTRKQSGVDLWI